MPGPTGTKPSQLQNPNAIDEQAQLEKMFADVSAAPMPQQAAPEQAVAQQQVPAVDEQAQLEQIFSDVNNTQAQETAPSDEFSYSNLGEGDFDNAWERAKLSIANATPNEIKMHLEKLGHKAIVRANEVYFKDKGEGKWKPFDSDKVTWNDVVADNAKAILETGLMAGIAGPSTVIGTAAGPAGTVAGAVAGQAVAAGLAESISSFIAENALGIEREEARQGVVPRLKETGQAAFWGGLFGVASKSIQGISKFRGDRLAKFQTLTDPAETVANVKAMAELEKEAVAGGIELSADGSKYALGSQTYANQNVPEITTNTELVAQLPEYKNWLNTRIKDLTNAMDSVFSSVAKVFPKKDEGTVYKTLQDAVENEHKYVGNTIGKFRKELTEEASKAPQEILNTKNVVSEITQELGFSLEGKMLKNPITTDSGRIIPSKLSALSDRTGIAKDQLKLLVNDLDSFIKKNYEGSGMTVEQLDGFYTELTKKINNLSKGDNRQVLGKFIQLKNAVRDDYIEAIGANLGDAAKAEYKGVLKDYSNIKMAIDDMGNLLTNNNMSRNAIVQGLFKGKDSLQRIQGIKTILQNNKPEVWQETVGELFNVLKEKSLNKTRDGIDFKKLYDNMYGPNGLGKEVINEIFDGSTIPKKSIDAFFKLADAFQRNAVKDVSSETSLNIAKKMMLVLAPNVSMTVRFNMLTNLIGMADSKGQLIKLLNGQNLQKFLGELPPTKREIMAKKLGQTLDYYNKGIGKFSPGSKMFQSWARQTLGENYDK